MPHSQLEVTYAKLASADRKLVELEVASGLYLANCCTLVQEKEASTGDIIFRVRDFVEPPVDLAVDVDSIVHDLRSILDQLMWRLIESNGSTPANDRAIQFPVFDDAPKYASGHAAMTSGLTVAQVAAIEALQPYNAPDPAKHPLWILHDMSTLDKHRRSHICAAGCINVTASVGYYVDMRNPNARPQTYSVTATAPVRLENGAIVGRSPSVDGVTKAVGDAKLASYIQFGPECRSVAGFPVLNVLKYIRGYFDERVLVKPGLLDFF